MKDFRNEWFFKQHYTTEELEQLWSWVEQGGDSVDIKLNAITTKQYDFLKKECIKFALAQKMIPCEVQAILWVQYRKAKKGEI